MSETLDELLKTIDSALSLMKSQAEVKFGDDIENLLQIRRVLENLGSPEIDAMLAEDDEEE